MGAKARARGEGRKICVEQMSAVDVERGNGDGAEFWVRSVLHPTG